MHVVVLMAGEGRRFEGYSDVPKPLIAVKGKTILEWTLSSLPFLSFRSFFPEDPNKCRLTFAIRQEHETDYNLYAKLRQTYGDDIEVHRLAKTTRGNLETGYQTLLHGYQKEEDEPLLFLDADNFYNGKNFKIELNRVKKLSKNFAMICHFQPEDDSEKWCFAKVNKNATVEYLSEKKKIEDGLPMLGVFYFSSKRLFINAAKQVFEKDQKVVNEFYMSQAIQGLIENNTTVYSFEATEVHPLGTPEDLEKFKNND